MLNFDPGNSKETHLNHSVLYKQGVKIKTKGGKTNQKRKRYYQSSALNKLV